MAKLSLTDLSNLQNENTAVSAINANSASIEAAMDKALFRDGSLPNEMNASLDMNSNRIINLVTALSTTEPVTLAQLNSILASHQVPNGLVTSGVPVSAAMQPVLNGATLKAARQLMGNDIAFLKGTYGAVGNGTANDTAAFTAANLAGGYLFIEPGTYKIDTVIINNLKGVYGLGRPNLIPSANVPTGVQAFFLLFSGSGCNDCIVDGLTITASATIWPQLYLLCCANTTGMHLTNNKTTGGNIGIYGAFSVNHTVERNYVTAYSNKGISHDGVGQDNINVIANYVDGLGSTIAHGISFGFGTRLVAKNNFVKDAFYFGIGAGSAGNIVYQDNIILNSGHEAFNTEDCSVVLATNNLCYWDVGRSHDFGCSIFGSLIDQQYSTVSNNIIINSNSAGIGLANRISFCQVTGNLILNCCRASTSGAIQLSGVNCLKNVITNNYCIDTVGGLQRSGVEEVNPGTGTPSLNYINNNYIEGWTIRATEHVNALIPASLTANTDNWAPTNFHYYKHINISSNAAWNLTGMSDGYADNVKVLYNGGLFTITLKENTTSSAGRRFFLGADYALGPSTSITLEWRSDVGAGNGGWVRI